MTQWHLNQLMFIWPVIVVLQTQNGTHRCQHTGSLCPRQFAVIHSDHSTVWGNKWWQWKYSSTLFGFFELEHFCFHTEPPRSFPVIFTNAVLRPFLSWTGIICSAFHFAPNCLTFGETRSNVHVNIITTDVCALIQVLASPVSCSSNYLLFKYQIYDSCFLIIDETLINGQI